MNKLLFGRLLKLGQTKESGGMDYESQGNSDPPDGQEKRITALDQSGRPGSSNIKTTCVATKEKCQI